MSIRACRRACLLLAAVLCGLCAAAPDPQRDPQRDPYRDHNGRIPQGYTGPLFKLSHDYPARLPAPPMPWRAAAGQRPLDIGNAAAYTAALKASVARDMAALLAADGRWDAGARGWYNDPWLGAQREALHGMLVGLEWVDPALFPKSGLRKPFTTYVVTYYDRTAAQTIGRIWAANPQAPNLTGGATLYAEGSLTVKFAFTTAGPDEWPAMRGALAWPIAMTANASTGHFDRPTLAPGYLMQVDIAVKDSQSSPQTGWVFTTFVYDKDAPPGAGPWDRMVALGAQWGNDPALDSTRDPAPALRETWINPQAPPYALETLGWGGRLSGPNDHAVNDISVAGRSGRVLVRNARNSSCLSCHGSSQWNPANPDKGMASFMMPLAAPAPGAAPNAGAPYLNSPKPGSAEWLRWFQNRPGSVPMDAGSIAGDYDLALTFRVLPAWHAAMTGKAHSLQKLDAGGAGR